MFKLFIVIMAIGLLQACSTAQPSDNQSVKKAIFQLTATHCTSSLEKVNNYRPNDELALIFPAIPGTIFGMPTNDVIQYVFTLPQKEFSLELPNNMGERAKAFSQKGLTIKPANTKVVRLDTFHTYVEDQEKAGGGLFIDTLNNDAYVLVYFSQAATISGVEESNGEKSFFNIQNAKPGWNWIKAAKGIDETYTYTLHDNSNTNIQFCAFIENSAST